MRTVTVRQRRRAVVRRHHLGGDAEGPEAVTRAVVALHATDPASVYLAQRDWLLGIDQHDVFDRAGNIGPTLWWDGEIIGSWAITPTGDIRTVDVANQGAEANEAIEDAVVRLDDRLDGTVVTPAIRTPLERSLVQASNPAASADQ